MEVFLAIGGVVCLICIIIYLYGGSRVIVKKRERAQKIHSTREKRSVLTSCRTRAVEICSESRVSNIGHDCESTYFTFTLPEGRLFICQRQMSPRQFRIIENVCGCLREVTCVRSVDFDDDREAFARACKASFEEVVTVAAASL